MKVAFFDTHSFERHVFEESNRRSGSPHEFTFIEARLSLATSIIAKGHTAVCAFVNDSLSRPVIEALSANGIKLIALRSAGFNNVDLSACEDNSIAVVRVPAYSPHAVAEHALGLILALNRKIHKSYQRVRDLNFSLEGLVGFDLYGKTVGVIGTGKIGQVFIKIMQGCGCRVLAYDVVPNKAFAKESGLEYVSLEELYAESRIISLHVPLSTATHHLINEKAITSMKKGVILINTSRGGLIDTPALIEGLKSGHIRGAGLDVYEEEEGIFFFDLSGEVLQDDVLARLLTFPNVVITSHQAFLTEEALEEIARTTVENIVAFEQGVSLNNEVKDVSR